MKEQKIVKAKKNLVTFDMSELDVMVEEGKKFLITPKAEDFLVRWKDFMSTIEQMNDQIKDWFKEKMAEHNCKKIEGQTITVSKRLYGERYEITDPQVALAGGFAKQVTYTKPDSEAIEMFVETSGDLPEGVKLRERTESVSITDVKVKEK